MTTATPRTVRALIARGDGPALGQPGRPDLDYAALGALCDHAARQLAAAGAVPGQAVAIVLPNGPEMAAAFLAVAGQAVAAPLNPAYTEDEFAFCMDDLDAGLLIVAAGEDTQARAAAARLGVRVVELAPGAAAGAFRFATLTASRCPRRRPRATAPTTSAWCCTPRAPPPGPRSCH